MKLSEIVPEIQLHQGKITSVIENINKLDFISKEMGDTYKSPTFGIDYIVDSWIKQPAFRQRLVLDLIGLALNVAEIRGPINVIRNEVFRKGIEVVPKFVRKCNSCKKEYDELRDKCDCGSTDLRPANEKQLLYLESMMEDANVFDKSLEDVLRQFDFYLNAVDDGFLYISKEYKIVDNIIRSKPIEIRNLNPAMVEYDLDANGIPKNSHWVCLIHRKGEQGIPAVHTQAGNCSICGFELEPVMFILTHRGVKYYLLDSEVSHSTITEPGGLYGYSKILTLFEKTLALIGMDRTLFRYFFERKMPPSMLMVFTDDPEGLRREKLNVQRETQQNPDNVPWIAVSTRQGTRGRAELVRLFHSLQEMEYTANKQDIRERISALWGVSPLWQGDVESIGGISSQTQQLVVTSRTVEAEQRLYNEKVFPFILNAFMEDPEWRLQLKQPEEKAEQTRLIFMQQRIGAANMMNQMGFDIKIRPGTKSLDEVQFEVSGEPKKQPAFGGGGFPGMGASYDTWMSQINKSGYVIDKLLKSSVSDTGEMSIEFNYNKDIYLAKFSPVGQLLNIQNKPRRKIPKQGTPAVKVPQEERVFTEVDSDEVSI